MLSIIISSYQPQNFSAIEKNIAETCGILYEIIKVDNPNLMGTCAAYNIGAEKANYENLLFIHEDIKFLTPNWGSKLMHHFNLKNIGLVGLAGGIYVPTAPCGWYTDEQHSLINLIQCKENGEKIQTENFKGISKEVFALDGVFLSVNKQRFSRYKFDEKLKGYHGYDTELSLRISKKYQNYVVSDILIEHFSQGKPDKNWFKSNIYIRNKLGSAFQQVSDNDVEYKSFEKFVEQYIIYFKINIKFLIYIIRYFPKNLKSSQKNLLYKKIYYYLRYRKKYNSRINHE